MKEKEALKKNLRVLALWSEDILIFNRKYQK